MKDTLNYKQLQIKEGLCSWSSKQKALYIYLISNILQGTSDILSEMDMNVFNLWIILGICVLSDVERGFCSEDTALDNPLAVCPEHCSCTLDFMKLHCKNSFKIEGHDLAIVTKDFQLTRDFIGPVLNETFSQLVSLEMIDMSFSKINFIQNGAFAGLSKLKKLTLRGNRIQMLDEYIFKDNLLLQVLDLSQNRIRYLQDGPFKFLPNLKMLNISYNKLTSANLGVRFQVTTRLAVIDFSGNNIETVTADDFFTVQRWEYVPKSLNFSNCHLKYIEADAIRSMKNLEFLGLANNKNITFENISTYLDALSSVTLKILDLSFVNITHKLNVSELTSENLRLLSLHELVLAGNGLSKIDVNLLSYLTIRRLDLSYNSFNEIGEGIASLTHLKYLDLSHNLISSVSELFKDNLGNLEYLKLSNNLLTNSSGLDIEKGLKLEQIDLSNNLFETFTVLPQLRKVRLLNLSGNMITNVNDGEPLAGLEKLISLDLSGNKITALNNFMFRDSRNIQSVNFAGNEISSISHQTFIPNCPKVIDLSRNNIESVYHFGWHDIDEIVLSRNIISTIEPQAFFFLDSLIKLDLSGNNLSALHVELFSHLTNLTELLLQGNNINQQIPILEILAPLQNLLKIDLSFNNFSSFDFLSLPFSHNIDLREIRITNNDIRMFSPYTFSSLHSLESVDFSRNPFHCSCENMPLQEWSRETGIEIKGQDNLGYICHAPNTRGRKTLMNFEIRTFECSRYLFYIVMVCSSGLACMLIAIATAIICYFYKKRRKCDIGVEKKSENIDMIEYEKMNKSLKEIDAITPGDYVRNIRENYLKGSLSDTLIDIEFENPNLLIDNRDDEKFIDKKQLKTVKREKSKSQVSKSKNNNHRMSDAKKNKYYEQLYELLREKNTKNGNNHKLHDNASMKKILEAFEKEFKKRDGKNSLKKLLIAMDKEYKRIQEKNRHSNGRHYGNERQRRSRGNKDLARMVSMRQGRSMPDVVGYVNSLPRHRLRSHRYAQIPIYHIDHADMSHHGWARSMVDIPRGQRLSSGIIDRPEGLERRDHSYERLIDDNRMPRGYHTVSSGRHAMMVDSRLLERARSNGRIDRRMSRNQLHLEEDGQPLIADEASWRVRRIDQHKYTASKEQLQTKDGYPINAKSKAAKGARSNAQVEHRISREHLHADEMQHERESRGYYAIASPYDTTLEEGAAFSTQSKHVRKVTISVNHLSPWI